MRVAYEPEAAEEVAAAALHYEAESEGLGPILMAELDEVVVRLADGRGVSASVPVAGVPDPSVRRLVLRRFPYSVVFVEHGDEVRIVAFAYHRRAPRYWAHRLG